MATLGVKGLMGHWKVSHLKNCLKTSFEFVSEKSELHKSKPVK